MCTTGCLTKNHQSYGECLQSKNLKIAYCRSSINERNDYTAAKKWDKNLDDYARVRKEGIQPDTTKAEDVRKAVEFSDKTGVAYGEWAS